MTSATHPSADIVRSAAPAGAVDCHMHVFDPARFAYVPKRKYTPGPASARDLAAFLVRVGVDRGVLVQPSVYGTDNRFMVEALAELGTIKVRGVGVVDVDTVTDAELKALRQAGVTGIRLNLHSAGGDQSYATDLLRRAARRFAPFGLAIQIYTAMELIDPLADAVEQSPVPVVFDHFAGAHAERGMEQTGMASVRRLLDAGRLWIKLSAPYRASSQAPDYRDLTPIATMMIRSNPERLVWASDWPHTGGGAKGLERSLDVVEPFRTIDVPHEIAMLKAWCGDDKVFTRIMVDNAVRLFQF